MRNCKIDKGQTDSETYEVDEKGPRRLTEAVQDTGQGACHKQERTDKAERPYVRSGELIVEKGPSDEIACNQKARGA